MKCKNCGKDLIQTSKKPKIYCSDKCRMAYNRRLLNEQRINEQPKKEVNEQEVKWTKGFCRWCGKVIKPEDGYGDNWDLIECCYDCVAKRNGINRNLYPKPA